MNDKIFQEKFNDGCRDTGLCDSTGTILVGFSGGSDSCVLLHMVNICFGEKRKIVAIHVNHSLRGIDSDKDAKHSKLFCDSRKIVFHEERISVPSTSSLGLEADARDLRTKVFQKYLEKYKSKVLVLGHHLNDNAETILMRLIEGSGIKGLSGIQQNSLHTFMSKKNNTEAKSSFVIFRPMLNIKKEEILNFAKSHNIQFVIDETNNDKKRFRNNIRHNIIPLLTESFGDAAIENIVSSSSNLNQARMINDEILYRHMQEHLDVDKNIVKLKNVPELKKKSLPIRSGIIKFAIETAFEKNLYIKKQRLPIKKYIESINLLIQSDNPSSSLDLGKGIEVRREYQEITLELREEIKKIKKIFPLKIGKVTNLEEFEMSAEIQLEENSNYSNKSENTNNIILLDNDSLQQEIVFRTRREGDRFHPRHSIGSKKLKKYLIDMKIPKVQRDSIPLLATGSEIIWIVGHEYSHNYQVTENTKKMLKISLNELKTD
tara:strand:+ start:5107 stop:6573 length:1467 start_codon:yes stop_codon:yes gene_type:complete